MRRRSGPPGPSMVCSRTLAMSAASAIKAMRASYCARAGALIEQRLDLRINRHGVFRGRPELLRGACQRRRGGGQESVEHLPRAFVEMRIVLAVERPDAVDEYAVHADRIAQRARAAAAHVVDPAW